jgi:ligand-binding sensor domain-containing protein
MKYHSLSLLGTIAVFIIAVASCNTQTTPHRLAFKSGIRAILQDSKGNMWFGSHSEGVAMFDGSQFRYYTTKDGLSDMQIRRIAEDRQGGIWFEGARGVSRYMHGVITLMAPRPVLVPEPWSATPTDLWFNANNTAGTNSTDRDPGVYRFDGISLHYHLVPIGKAVDPKRDASLSTPSVTTSDGTVWFGAYGAVAGFKDGTFTVITDTTLSLDDATGRLHVRALFADSKGNLWIGNNSIGVIRTNIRGGSPSPVGTMKHVFAIGEDADGNIWFGDRDTGAWKYDGTQFTNYTLADGLSTTHIWSIYRDRLNRLLFAMGDGAVCRWTGERFVREW